MENNKHISGIHDYCDKWCERCLLARRCAIYDPSEHSDEPMHVLFNKITQSFSSTLEHLYDWVERHDVDLTKCKEEEHWQFGEEVAGNYTNDSWKVVRLAQQYESNTTEFLESENIDLEHFFESIETQAELGIAGVKEEAMKLVNALETIQWYQHQIHSKMTQAFQGNTALDGDSKNSAQFESNGHAKVALIGIQRSMIAWETLINLLRDDSAIWPFLVTLEKLRILIEKNFPNANNFVRPGFDTEI